jgi:glycosyltransferase involved in cell wall biosynthesis
VVVDIAGHRDAVIDGVTGVLVSPRDQLGTMIADVLLDDPRREALSAAALAHAATFSWDAVALRLFELLVGSRAESAS